MEQIEANPIEARELAAARLLNDALAVMHKSLETSGLSETAVAEILGVPVETIQEMLEGSRRFSLEFVGRFVKACGFQARLTFKEPD